MEDKDYKDLDQFFKSRLNQKEAQSNGWDIPSDAILDNAMEQVITSKPNRKFPILASLGGLLLLTVIAGFYILRSQDHAQIEALNKEIAVLKVELDKKAESPASLKTTELKESNPIIQAPTTAEVIAIKENTVATSKKAVPKAKQNTILSESRKVSSVQKRAVSNLYEFHANSRTVAAPTKNLISENAAPAATKEFAKKINKLAFNTAFINHQSFPSLEMDDLDLITTEDDRKKINAYLTLGHLLSSVQMTNLSPTSYALTDYDKYYGGWEMGLGLAMDLSNKIQLKTELSYSLINNESNFHQNTDYKKENELTSDQGDIFYATELDINSPTGNHVEKFLIDVTHEEMLEGEQMDNYANINQRFQVLSLNTGLTQQLFNKNDFNIALYGGVGINAFLNASQDMEISIEHLSHKMASKSVQMDGMYALNKFYLNGRGGIEFNKLFSDKYFVGLSAGYNRSLTSIRKSKNTNEPNTYIGSFQSMLKIGYKF